MSSTTQTLPSFDKPPVIETVLGVYFRPSEKFTTAQLGILWDRCFRQQFPRIEERPPTEEVPEQFGEMSMFALPMIRWQITNRPDAFRLWAASAHGQHVVQIQRNAFFANWLRTSGSTAYRPYGERREEFATQLDQLGEFFEKQGIGRIEPTSWIVTYVNHIDYKGIDYVGSEVAEKLTVWTNQFSDGFLHEPDRMMLAFGFPMPNNAGRLKVNLAPVVLAAEKRQALRLDLTA